MQKIHLILAIFIGISCNDCTPDKESENIKPDIPIEPPFNGTIFLDPDIITPDDPSAYSDMDSIGAAERMVFDRRENNWVTINAYLFEAHYKDGFTVEMQINTEFEDSEMVTELAGSYAFLIGQLPQVLRVDLETVTIHRGDEPFGGGNRNVLIHTDYAEKNYVFQGILEETLVHEATHTSLDDRVKNLMGWKDAQKNDNTFISTYAKDFPTREDLAETFLLYFALRYRPERISQELINTIEQTIPHRIEFFDSQDYSMFPQE